jgi:hypothetical protein
LNGARHLLALLLDLPIWQAQKWARLEPKKFGKFAFHLLALLQPANSASKGPSKDIRPPGRLRPCRHLLGT